MKFFTRAWLQGELTDEESDLVVENYRRHIASLKLPNSLAKLANLTINDAYVMSATHSRRANTLSLRLRCGDKHSGYYDLLLKFADYEPNGFELQFLDFAAESRKLKQPVEALYDEIDRVKKKYEYRIIFWPAGEVSIKFSALTMTTRKVKSRKSR